MVDDELRTVGCVRLNMYMQGLFFQRWAHAVLGAVFRYFGITASGFFYQDTKYCIFLRNTKYKMPKVGWELPVFRYFEPFERPFK